MLSTIGSETRVGALRPCTSAVQTTMSNFLMASATTSACLARKAALIGLA